LRIARESSTLQFTFKSEVRMFFAFIGGIVLTAILVSGWGEKGTIVFLGGVVGAMLARMFKGANRVADIAPVVLVQQQAPLPGQPAVGKSHATPPSVPVTSPQPPPQPIVQPIPQPVPQPIYAPTVMNSARRAATLTPVEKATSTDGLESPIDANDSTDSLEAWKPDNAPSNRAVFDLGPEATSRPAAFEAPTSPQRIEPKIAPIPASIPVAHTALEPPTITDGSAQPAAAESGPPPLKPRTPPAWPGQPAYAQPASDVQLPGWLSGLLSFENWPIKLAMILILVALASGFRYLAAQGYFDLPMQYRLLGVAAGSLVALAFAWTKRESNRSFSLSVQGASLASLLITIYAALQLYELIPGKVAFSLMLIVVALGVVLAVLQDALWLALFAQIGGFAAPILSSTGGGDYRQLFGYYLVLNVGMLAIAMKKGWRSLNVLGALATFGIGLTWGAQYYQPEYFGSVEPFLLAFFAIYLAITILYTLRHESEPVLDAVLIFGVPMATLLAQAGLLDSSKDLGIFAFVTSILYGALSYTLWSRTRLLAQCFLILAFSFFTFSIPCYFDAQITSALWALEGAGALWLGIKQKRTAPQFIGLALQVLAWVSFIYGLSTASTDPALLSERFVGAVLLAAGSWFCSMLLERANNTNISVLASFTTFVWLAFAAFTEIDKHVSKDYQTAALVFSVAGVQVVLAALSHLLRTYNIRWISMMGVASWPILVEAMFQSQNGRLLASVCFVLSALGTLYFLRDDESAQDTNASSYRNTHGYAGLQLTHAAWLIGLCWMFARGFDASGFGDGTLYALRLLPFAAVFLMYQKLPLITWPLQDIYFDDKRGFGQTLLQLWGFGLAAAVLIASTLRGDAMPLPYVPVFNPLELVQLGVLWMLWRYGASDLNEENTRWLVGVLIFWLSTTIALRVTVQMLDPSLDNLLEAFFNRKGQAVLAVVWSIVGCGAMLYGHGKHNRNIWIGGAVLMVIVVAKMFLIDRHNLNQLYGIFATLAVGMLLAVVGYFAPAPPAEPSNDNQVG
jgi:uncharacterized membrane protein